MQITRQTIKELEVKKKFYLEEEFRNVLFTKAYAKEGSLRQLGRKLAYRGPSPNYYVNRMWRGEQAIRFDQLKTLAEITHISLSTILKNSRSDAKLLKATATKSRSI